jgi:hypothetical protein
MLFNKQPNVHPLHSMAHLLPSILFDFILGGLVGHLIPVGFDPGSIQSKAIRLKKRSTYVAFKGQRYILFLI